MEEDTYIRFVFANGSEITAPDNGLFEKIMATDEPINAIAVEDKNRDYKFTIINWANVCCVERI